MDRRPASYDIQEDSQLETQIFEEKKSSAPKETDLKLTDLKGLVRGELFRINIESKISEIEKVLEDFESSKKSNEGSDNPFFSSGLSDFISELANTRKLIRYDDLTSRSQRVLMNLIKKILVFGQRKLSAFFKKMAKPENGRDVYINEISYLLNDTCDICYSYSSASNEFVSHFQRFQMEDEVRVKGANLLLSLIHNRYIIKYRNSSNNSDSELNYWLKYLLRSASRAIAYACALQNEADESSDEEGDILESESFRYNFTLNEDFMNKNEFALSYLKKREVFDRKIFNKHMLMVLRYLDSRPFADAFTQMPESNKNILISFIENFLEYSYSTLIPLIEQINEKQANHSNLFSSESSSLLLTFVTQSTFLQHVMGITLNVSNRSVYFCNQLNKSEKGLVLLMRIIQNPMFIDYSALNIPNDILINHQVFPILKSILGTLPNLSKSAFKYRVSWQSLEVFRVLLNLSQKFAGVEDDDPILAIYLTIANIATDEDIEKLTELRNVAKRIVDKIHNCATVLAENDRIERADRKLDCSLSRMSVQLEEYQNEIFHISLEPGGVWLLTELIQPLYNFAVNDSFKQFIYYELNIKEDLITILTHGNEIETEYSLSLLYQLCFDKRIAHDVLDTKALFEYIVTLKPTKAGLVKTRDGILWLVKSHMKETSDQTHAAGNKHIMISYNSESRDYCLKIKAGLEEKNYKVWIDVHNISGSALESMARAVENSWCVLMFMTEKYKDSANCRLEAEYCVNLKKPIIPFIAQEKYRTTGW